MPLRWSAGDGQCLLSCRTGMFRARRKHRPGVRNALVVRRHEVHALVREGSGTARPSADLLEGGGPEEGGLCCPQTAVLFQENESWKGKGEQSFQLVGKSGTLFRTVTPMFSRMSICRGSQNPLQRHLVWESPSLPCKATNRTELY